MQTFRCSCCGAAIPGPPLDWSFNAPDLWWQLSDEERAVSELHPDQCVINGEHFFIRGVIEIAVVDDAESFAYGVWASLSEKNFLRAAKTWDDPKRAEEPACFGWLCNSIPGYPETLHLKTMVHTREIGVRPLIELEPNEHPLAIEQRKGITTKRVREIAEMIHHRNLSKETA
ncbi:MAG TPA: DUF2199 domain-containing protein [Bryobacteraceae bacterium]|jgi:hypothetical protein